MDRWREKLAIVTGASSGIGASIATHLLKAGVKVVCTARNMERFAPLMEEWRKIEASEFHTFKCDMTKEEDILKLVEWVNTLGGADILVNNAGIYNPEASLIDGPVEAFRATMNTNFLGVAIITREIVKSMLERKIDGHIIFVNSIDGHYVPRIENINLNVYPASKHGIRAYIEALRHEFINRDIKIKLSGLSPGFVQTNIVPIESKVDIYKGIMPEDCAQAVIFMLSTPPNVQIQDLIIRPVMESY